MVKMNVVVCAQDKILGSFTCMGQSVGLALYKMPHMWG